MKAIIATTLWVAGYAIATVMLTGCAGVELGARAGLYRVDQRQESQATHAKPLPLKCYIWADCTSQAVAGANNGMVEGS